MSQTFNTRDSTYDNMAKSTRKRSRQPRTRKTLRVGFGYDVHPFAAHRKLFLGGIEIPHEKGLAGHSDADVLLHAICDALLGAAALGDIGQHFPNSDARFNNISSLELLARVNALLERNGCLTMNIDATVVLEHPKIASYVDLMRRAIAQTLKIQMSQVSVKATTNEGMGFVGRGEGCAAYAVACIQSPS